MEKCGLEKMQVDLSGFQIAHPPPLSKEIE